MSAERLRALAIERAREAHEEAIRQSQDYLGHVDDMAEATADSLGFPTCPHPDCVLVRSALGDTGRATPADGRILDLLEEAATLIDDGRVAETETMKCVYRDVIREAIERLRAIPAQPDNLHELLTDLREALAASHGARGVCTCCGMDFENAARLAKIQATPAPDLRAILKTQLRGHAGPAGRRSRAVRGLP